MDIRVRVILTSGREIDLSQEEFEEMKAVFKEKEYIYIPNIPSYPSYPWYVGDGTWKRDPDWIPSVTSVTTYRSGENGRV